MLPKITIIGRPNVGKSSFFNMYTGHKIAIVADEPGTTRDITEFEYHDKEHDISYIVSDSGGLDFSSSDDEISRDIIERTSNSIDESELLIWIIEYDKLTTLDDHILKVLRNKKVENVIVVANKADNEQKILESYSLAGTGGYEEFFPVSVSHNKGISEIKEFVYKFLKSKKLDYKYEEIEESEIKLAIVGRPNVGKSSIINAITDKNRVMVKDMAGTTRDAIDTRFSYEGDDFVLIDTAGIRRLSKVGVRNIEDWSLMRTDRAISRSDVVAVITDGGEGLVHQDLAIVSKVLEEKKGLIIVVNKWDKVLVKENIQKEKVLGKYMEYMKSKIEFLSWVTVIFTTALERKRVLDILPVAKKIKEERKKRVKTSVFNNFIEQVVLKHAPTGNKKSHSPKIYYGSQVDICPPKFLLTVNNPDHFHFSYKRYLENKIRDTFGYEGTPIIIEYKGRGKHADKIK